MKNTIKLLKTLTISGVCVVAVFFALAMYSMEALSEVKIGNFMASDHHDEFEYNEDHSSSFYICYESVCGGAYENSYEQTSRLVFYETQFGSWGDSVRFTVPIGLVDGYKGYNGNMQIRPFAAVTASYDMVKTDYGTASVKFWQAGLISVIGFEIAF